jgi:hypothetical protein
MFGGNPMTQDNILKDINDLRIQHAAAFLDGSDYMVHKTTRSGFTTSFVKAAERSSKRVLLLSPTNRIIDDTMCNAADIVRIYGNSACKYNQDEIKQVPLLAKLPMGIPEDCDKCKYAEGCCILDIYRNPDANMKSMTLAKFEAVMTSDSARSVELREILSNVDVVLPDEAHKLVASDVPKVPIRTSLYDLKLKIQDKFPSLNALCDRWHRFRDSIERLESDLWDQIEQDGKPMTKDWLIRELEVHKPIESCNRPKYWGELRKLAKQHREYKVSEDEVLCLLDLIQILSQETARLSYISSDQEGQLYVCGCMGRMNIAIHDYITNYARNASVVFVSGTLYEPHKDYFKSIVGREKFLNVIESPFQQEIFPDLLCTNDKMTVFADTFRLSGTTPQKFSKLPKIVDRIKKISEAEGNASIYLLSPNKDFHVKLLEALEEYKNISCDYYRSKNTIGVENSCRIGIAIGLAEVPLNTYDCLANSYGESQTIRINDVDAGSWQAWSRIKDPQGRIPSKLYCIGVKKEDATRVLTWGPGRIVKKTEKYQYGVECTEELPKPVVMAPYKLQVHPEQRKSSPYIKKIWDAEKDFDDLPAGLKVYEVELPKNSRSTLLYNKRGYGGNEDFVPTKVQCFGALFSKPDDFVQYSITVDTLDRFFRSNRTNHAEQQTNRNAKGKVGYYRCNTGDWFDLIVDMFHDLVTPATYPIGEDGSTVQCAFDMDNHNGTNPSVPRVDAAVKHIQGLGIQPIVVASGSVDSYHIHMPILPTSIGVSHNFIKTMHFELKQSHVDLDFKNDTEAFPKQKNKKTPFGNPLKLPLAINNKTGIRSQILDPDTKEPVDVIFITKVLELRQPEEEAVKVGAHQYLSESHPTPRKVPGTFSPRGNGTMRPCILQALNQKLEGGEGHDMRLAIVGEALAAGKNREEIIHLFEGQDDFDETTTANNVDYLIEKNYITWKCETLQERCPTFIDCKNCQRTRIESPENIADPATAK